LFTKFGLAQFTATLFWRFGDAWHRAPNIFDALPPHTIAVRYTRPIKPSAARYWQLVRFWHKADIPTRSINVRFWG
jgi:hypothetical protein